MKTLKQTTLALSIAALTTVSASALAGKGSHNQNNYNSVDYAKVISVHSVTKQIKVSVPVERCYDKQVWRETSRSRVGHGHKNEVIGALIGAAVGNQIGKNAKPGNGREIGTVAGAVIGGVIGNSHARHHRPKPSGYYTTVRQCDTHHDVSYENQVVGYDVQYKYRGQVYSTRTNYHPGDRLKVSVSVKPYDYS